MPVPIKLSEFLKFLIICGNIIFETKEKFARGDEFLLFEPIF